MVRSCIVNYDENQNVIGCTRSDGASGGLDFLSDCEALGLTITYKTQAELDNEALATANAIRVVEIDTRLDKIDILSVRSLRSKTNGRGNAADDSTLLALDDEAIDLRTERATLI